MAALTVPSNAAVAVPADWIDLKVVTGDVVIAWDDPNVTTATGLPLANGQAYSRAGFNTTRALPNGLGDAVRTLYARASTGTAEIRWI